MAEPHKLNPQAATPQANEALAAVSDALAQWRDEVATSTETNVAAISDKIAKAARQLGWPKEVVEAAQNYLQQTSGMQLQMLDQLVDAWQQQLKSPMPAQFVSALRMPTAAIPGSGGAAATGDMTNPMAFWLQATLAWQRTMTSAWQQVQRQAEQMQRTR